MALDTEFAVTQQFFDGHNRLYVIGDVHGHAEELDDILQQILADIEKYPFSKSEIVVAGDMVNRGPRTKDVLDRLASLQKSPPRNCKVTLILGNHDISLLSFLKPLTPEKKIGSKIDFLKSGGLATLASYGVFVELPEMKDGCLKDALEQLSRDQIIAIQKNLIEQFPIEHNLLLLHAKKFHKYRPEGQETGYFICHGGVDLDVAIDQQDVRVIIGADYKLGKSREFARSVFTRAARDVANEKWAVIHGHTIIGDAPIIKEWRISLDTGCFDGGSLSCIVVVDGEPSETFQCKSLYPPYDSKVLPTMNSWPPQKLLQHNDAGPLRALSIA